MKTIKGEVKPESLVFLGQFQRFLGYSMMLGGGRFWKKAYLFVKLKLTTCNNLYLSRSTLRRTIKLSNVLVRSANSSCDKWSCTILAICMLTLNFDINIQSRFGISFVVVSGLLIFRIVHIPSFLSSFIS